MLANMVSFIKFCSISFTEWCKEYESERPNVRDLQKEIDEFMQVYDQQVAEVSL